MSGKTTAEHAVLRYLDLVEGNRVEKLARSAGVTVTVAQAALDRLRRKHLAYQLATGYWYLAQTQESTRRTAF